MSFYDSKDARSIYGLPFIDAGSGLPPVTNPESGSVFYAVVMSPLFGGVHAYVDMMGQTFVRPTTTTITNNFTASDETDTPDTNGSGTATFGIDGVELATGTTANSDAGIRVASWKDNSEIRLFRRTSSMVLTFDGSELKTGTGDFEIMIGVVDQVGYIIRDNTATTAGFWLYGASVGGTWTLYFVTANGSAVTATDITPGGGPILAASRRGTFKVIGETSIAYIRGGATTPVATHTTNLPTGTMSNNFRFICVIANNSGDDEDRQFKINNLSHYVN